MAKTFDPDVFLTNSIFPIRIIEKLRIRMIRSFLSPTSADVIVEIGCGAGNLMQTIDSGAVLGIDISQYLLDKAKDRVYRTRVEFIKAFGQSLPLRDKSVSKVYCSEVLEHVVDPGNVVTEAARILRDDGLFVASIPNEPFIDRLKDTLFNTGLANLIHYFQIYHISRRMTDEWHLHSGSTAFLKKILKNVFQVTKVRFIPAPFFPLRIVVQCRKKGSNER